MVKALAFSRANLEQRDSDPVVFDQHELGRRREVSRHVSDARSRINL